MNSIERIFNMFVNASCHLELSTFSDKVNTTTGEIDTYLKR